MFALVILAVIAQAVFAPTAATQPNPNGKLGNLIVTATSISTQPAHDPGQHYVAVAVRVRNSNTEPACATLSAELHGPNDLVVSEIERSSTNLKWPAPPPVSHLAHGDESTGNFVFEIKDATEPLDLVVKLDSSDTTCDAPLRDLAAAPPPEIHLDLRDLQIGPGATTTSNADLPTGGAHGYGMPACLNCPRAEYPKEAMKAKVHGVVHLSVTITAEGTVTDVRVTQGLGHGLDEAAVAAVSRWRLKPAIGPDGQPAAVRQIIEVTFQLKNFPF